MSPASVLIVGFGAVLPPGRPAPAGRIRLGNWTGTYHWIVDEEWRVSITLDEVPRTERKRRMRSLLEALRARLGD
jgi:hypothetical protein